MFDVGSSSAICFGTLVSGLIERGLDLKIYDGRHKNAYNLTCIWHILFPKRRPPDTTCGHSPVESRRKGCLPSLNSPNASYPDDNKCLTPMASASKEMRLNGGNRCFPFLLHRKMVCGVSHQHPNYCAAGLSLSPEGRPSHCRLSGEVSGMPKPFAHASWGS